MGTSEVKDVLSELYPNESFKRRNKAIDSYGYTHRTMESANRIVVATSDDDEDFEVVDVIEVNSIPSAASLKDENRLWMTGGRLSGYVFRFESGEDPEPEWLEISPSWYRNKYQSQWDGEGEVSYIRLTAFDAGIILEQVMEGTWEWHMTEKSEVRDWLLKLGAKEIPSMII